MQRVQELFLLDGWVEVGQFVLLMFSIFKETFAQQTFVLELDEN